MDEIMGAEYEKESFVLMLTPLPSYIKFR